MRKHKKMICILGMVLLMTCLLSTAAFAAGDVASAVENTWKDAASQIKTVVDNVVFPALDMSLTLMTIPFSFPTVLLNSETKRFIGESACSP